MCKCLQQKNLNPQCEYGNLRQAFQNPNQWDEPCPLWGYDPTKHFPHDLL
jgi:hypothetical protein